MTRTAIQPGIVRALTIALFLLGAATAAQAQCRPVNRDPRDTPDTVKVARVVLIAPSETYNPTALGCFLNGHTVVSIFATDGPGAAQMATRLQTALGGAVVAFARAGRTGTLFASALVDSVVIKTGGRNLDKTLLIVAEPELFKPILASALGDRGAEIEVEMPPPVLVLGLRANGRCCTLTRPVP